MGGRSLALSVVELALVLLTVVLTVTAMEPLNQAVNTWDAGRLPPAGPRSRRDGPAAT